MTTAEQPITAESQAQRAYLALRDMLVRLEIAPGAPITETAMMDRIGVGRTPLREALHRLESDRLVTIFPRRGTFASEINLADLALITDLRVELEGLAAARAAASATGAERTALAAMAGRVGDGDPEDQMALDTEIHRAVYAAAHNHFLETTATRYYNLSMRIWRLFMARLDGVEDHVAEHGPLLKRIVAGDEESARRRAEAHVRSFETTVRRLL